MHSVRKKAKCDVLYPKLPFNAPAASHGLAVLPPALITTMSLRRPQLPYRGTRESDRMLRRMPSAVALMP